MRETDEQNQQTSKAKIKQRIAGGSVLILVLAIFLPFIFNHSHLEHSVDVNAENTNPPVENITTPIPQESQESPVNSNSPELTAPQAESKAASVPEALPGPATAPLPPIAAATTTKAAEVKKGWVVQVGSFNEPIYARQLSIKLNHQGLKVFTQKDPSRPQVRVFLGPFATQKQAQQFQQHLKEKYKLNGIVKEN